MMIVCNEAGIFDQLWKLLFGDDLIRKNAFHWYAKEVDVENEVCILNCFIQDRIMINDLSFDEMNDNNNDFTTARRSI